MKVIGHLNQGYYLQGIELSTNAGVVNIVVTLLNDGFFKLRIKETNKVYQKVVEFYNDLKGELREGNLTDKYKDLRISELLPHLDIHVGGAVHPSYVYREDTMGELGQEGYLLVTPKTLRKPPYKGFYLYSFFSDTENGLGDYTETIVFVQKSHLRIVNCMQTNVYVDKGLTTVDIDIPVNKLVEVAIQLSLCNTVYEEAGRIVADSTYAIYNIVTENIIALLRQAYSPIGVCEWDLSYYVNNALLLIDSKGYKYEGGYFKIVSTKSFLNI